MIRAEGLDESIKMLNEIAGARWVEQPLKEYGTELVGVTKPYIPKPPQSTYRRRHHMINQWFSLPSGNRVVIENRAPYSGWVQQRATQAWMHERNGWHTIEDKAESQHMEQFFIQKIKQAFDRLVRKYA